MQVDRPFLGVLLMLAFCVLAPLGDSLAKLLGGTVPLGVLIFVRFSIQVVILLPILLWSRQSLRLESGLLPLTLIRSCLHILGIGMMFSSLRFLPLADAIAILGEHVGRHRIIACAVGFLGTLLVIQPNFAAVGYPALLPLGVAVVFSLFMLITRQIAKTIDPIKLQAISGMQASAILLPMMLIFSDVPGVGFAPLATDTLPLLALLGVLGTIAHLFMTWSLRFAPSATLAPMQYLEIPIGTFIGWLIFKDLPNGLAAIGICITVGAGLYIILRERRLSLQADAASAA